MDKYRSTLRVLLDAATLAAKSQDADANDRQFEARDFADQNVPDDSDERMRAALRKVSHAICLAQYPTRVGNWARAVMFLEHAGWLLSRVEGGEVEYVAGLMYRGHYFGGPEDGKFFEMGDSLNHGVSATVTLENLTPRGNYDVAAHIEHGEFRMEWMPRGTEAASRVDLQGGTP